VLGLILVVCQLTVTDSHSATAVFKYLSWATLGAAALLIFVAQYDVWKEEREKYETELAKYSSPDIKGEAFAFHALSYGDGIRHDEIKSCGGRLQFDITICNHRPILTNLTGIEIDATNLKPRADFSHIDTFNTVLVNTQMPMGISVCLRFTADVFIPGFHHRDLGPIDMTPLKIRLKDGFGHFHEIGARGELVFFQS
jgi:hypothetical protein